LVKGVDAAMPAEAVLRLVRVESVEYQRILALCDGEIGQWHVDHHRAFLEAHRTIAAVRLPAFRQIDGESHGAAMAASGSGFSEMGRHAPQLDCMGPGGKILLCFKAWLCKRLRPAPKGA
jgi:hypothetical protein